MSGIEAVRQLLALAQQEEFLAAELVARALSLGTRKVIRDWRRRQLPEKRVGRTILLPSRTVVVTYFSDVSPST